MSQPPAPTSSQPTPCICLTTTFPDKNGARPLSAPCNPDGSCPPGFSHGNTGIRKYIPDFPIDTPSDLLPSNPLSGWGDGLTKIFGHLLDKDFWKGIGLLLAAAGLLVVGVVIWFRKDLEAGAVAAA